MPIYGKNPWKASTPEPRSFEAESCFIASVPHGLPRFFKWWPQIDLWLFLRQDQICLSPWAIHMYKIATAPIFISFYSAPSVERALSIYTNGSAPLNKVAAMPIYGKTQYNLLLQNQGSFETESWYKAFVTRSTKFVQIMILGWPLILLRQDHIASKYFCMGKMLKNQFL